MKLKLTNIEYADCGCPLCGGHDGDYGGSYEEPPESVEIEVEGLDLNGPDYEELSQKAELPHLIETCEIEVINE